MAAPRAHEDERFYGLGQHQHGLLNQAGPSLICCIAILKRRFPCRTFAAMVHFGITPAKVGWNWAALRSDGRRRLFRNSTCFSGLPMICGSDGTMHRPAGSARGVPRMGQGLWISRCRYKDQTERAHCAASASARLADCDDVGRFFTRPIRGIGDLTRTIYRIRNAWSIPSRHVTSRFTSHWPTVNPAVKAARFLPTMATSAHRARSGAALSLHRSR